MKRRRGLLSIVLTSFAVVMINCGGGGGGATTTPTTGENSVVAAVRNSVPVSACPNGGIQVDTGIDDNGNSILDASEVDSTQYVCNGTNGLSTLALVSTEPTGPNCVNGGKKVSVGLDANGNSILDALEVTSSDYICNGADGSGGLNSLVSIVTEPAGANCANGGLKMNSGLDSDADGVLDAAEVSSTNYICNGADGAAGPGGITWVEVTGESQQAASNTGYMANSASQVTITLPASDSLALGDIVQVSGVGPGGWKIAQNAGQSIMTKSIAPWVKSLVLESFRHFTSVASSADGTKLVAMTWDGEIFTSTDSGISWSGQWPFSNPLFKSVASSADGVNLVAVGARDAGQIYTSTDSGATWTPRDSNNYRNWSAVASSSDGRKLVAASVGQLYTSTDFGASWTARESARGWRSVASSADGAKLVAVAYYDQIYTSTNSGVTWTARAASDSWQSVASSADGSKLVAMTEEGRIYTSADSGRTWTEHRVYVGPLWSSSLQGNTVASSADGTKLVAAGYGGPIYHSTDSGVTWTAQSERGEWTAIASSADGTRLVAVQASGGIYTTIQSTTTGTAGSIRGGQYDAITLQYAGNDTFTVLSHEGYLIVD